MKVYLVEGVIMCPGKIYAIFADVEDAWDFIAASGLEDDAEVWERTLFYGQPPYPGYNE
jgi:hypothetical protein